MVDDFFWATIGFIFLSGIVSAFLRLRQRDTCLKLVHDHFVTFTRRDGSTVWGDLQVFSRGMKINYLKAHHTRRGVVKSGSLLYSTDLEELLVIVGYAGQLSPREIEARQNQVDSTFHPGLFRRGIRLWRNAYNTLHDAFVRSFSFALGRAVRQTGSEALTHQEKSLDQTGQAVMTAADHAFEPMLEAHMGQSIVLELVPPGGGEARLEVSGYLADYTDKYIALFNVEHPSGELIEVSLVPGEEAGPVEGLTLTWNEQHLRIQNDDVRMVYIEGFRIGDGPTRMLGATLIKGAVVSMARPPGACTLLMRWVDAVDMFCPRSCAFVRYVGDRGSLGPAETEGIAPAHCDENRGFP